jgi:uncharacterized protein YhaN
VKLRCLELEQFRKFDLPVRLGGLVDGLNILAGPNEFGKSTILAAIRGLLFERHSSRAEKVRRMQNWRGNAAPRLAMEFKLGGGLWRIEKRFMHQPSARLTAPDGRVFDADAAEEELQRLLNFGAAGRKSTGGEQHGVWGALWVTQRQSVEQADLSSDLAKSTFSACLDAEVGVLTGSERGHAVKRAAEAQLARLLDGNNRPKGRYKDGIAELAALSGELDDLRGRARQLQDASDALRQAQAKLARIADPVAAAEDRAALEDARRRLTEAQNFVDRREKLVMALDLAQRAVDSATAEASRRVVLDGEIRKSAAAHADAVGRAGRARADFDLARGLAASARDAAERAAADAAKAADSLRHQRDILSAVEQDSRRRALERTLDQAEAAQSTIEQVMALLADSRIDKPGIDAIRKAARDHGTAEAALRALATEIEFDIEDSGGGVTVDGVPVQAGRSTIHAVNSLDIAIPGIGRIAIRPAMQDRETVLASARKARDRLAALLSASACATLDDAELDYARHDRLQAALAEARARLAQLTPGDDSHKLTAGLAALREHVGVLRLNMQGATARLGIATFPSREAALRDLSAADDADAAGRAALTIARADQDAAARAAAAAETALIRVEEEAKAAAAELARLNREAALAATSEPPAALAARARQAELDRIRQANLLAQMDRERPADSVAGMQARIERYAKSIDNREAASRKLGEDIAELRARITFEGGAGLDELIGATERRADELVRERDASAFDAETLRLLLDCLTEAERQTRERYLAPITRRISPYLAGLFPGATIVCDDDLRITSLSRDGQMAQSFDRLSDGTQEQIAVLARLAFAELLLDQGKPAMVILDDALAYSDDERMERMFDTLIAAARRMQILVLTCRENLYARSGGHQLRLEAMRVQPRE